MPKDELPGASKQLRTPPAGLTCRYATEIVSAATIGTGFGFLPSLWKRELHGERAVFMDEDVSLALGPKLVIYQDRSPPRIHAMSGFVSRLKDVVGRQLAQ